MKRRQFLASGALGAAGLGTAGCAAVAVSVLGGLRECAQSATLAIELTIASGPAG